MDKKSSKNVPTFPNIYFLVDDFESVWEKVYLKPNQEFCVELVVEIDPKFLNLFPNKKRTRDRVNHTTAFLGASSYTVIEEGLPESCLLLLAAKDRHVRSSSSNIDVFIGYIYF